MPDDGENITAHGNSSLVDRCELSVGARVLMGSLEARMFGQLKTTRLGRYQVLEVLGRGAMGVVYKAYDPQLDRTVAVKVLSQAGEDPRARMVREAKALAKLNHPNVVTVYEVAEDGGELFVAMEYVEGGTLAQWCAAHPEPSRDRTQTLVGFALQALDGLAAAHDLGLVHRDMKPANMLIGADGRLRVADFGLARAFASAPELLASKEVEPEVQDGSPTPLTQTGAVVGTPAFMALEQFRGHADASSDQFGLCASFFAAFYGAPAYEATSAAALLEALEHGHVADPPSNEVPDYVRRVLLRGLQPLPKDRFESARAVASALRGGARRRRWTAGGAMAGVGAVAVASVVWTSQPEPCGDDRARIERVVDGQAVRVAGLIEASGRPHPDELADRFSTGLDGVVVRWSTQQLEACRASRDRDPEVAQQGDRQLHCLDAAVEATEHTLRGIESLTRRQADALPAVTRLIQGVHDCDDADRDEFGNEKGRRLLALFRSGLAAEGRLDHENARASYEAVLHGSEPGEFAHLRSETYTRLSEVCDRTGDVEAFKRHLIGSLDEAENAGDAELTALHWLAVADTLPLTESDEAFELIVSRSYRARERGSISDWTLAQLLYAEAKGRSQRGQHDRALPLLLKAITVGEKVGAPALAFMYELESFVRLSRGEFKQAEARARDAVQTHAARVGENHPEVAGFLRRLAGTQSWQGRDVEAAATYGQAVSILEARPGYMSSALFRAYSGRASALRNTEDLEGALLDYDKAAGVAEGLGGSEGAKLLTTINEERARTYRAMNRPREALRLVELVLTAPQDGSAETRAMLAYAAILRAGILADLKREGEALAQLEDTMSVIANAFYATGVERVQAAVEISEIYVQLGEHLLAQAEIDRFLPLAAGDPMFRSMLERTRAQSYADQGRRADARTWANRSLASVRASGAGQHEIEPVEALIASLEEEE
ncbi:MAG: serine/threonine-protein kinase [Nannocystaceae bacterium]|nr:serine/threonine-protein kinase [Nannocystaceae bacterium]